MPADGYLNFDTKIDTDGFDDGLKDVNRHVKGFSSALGGLGRTIKTAFNTAVIAAFGKAVIDSAADVKAAGAQFEQTFGEMQDAAKAAIDRVAKPADIISERLRGSATSIYAFAKTAKMETSTAMTFMEDALRAAADSAAYYDRSIEDTTKTLQSFLKGNYENDAALGLSATETTRNAKAMQLYGKSFKNLSEAQKQITLLEMVKEANALSGAMGQAAREADGWANVTGNLSEAWKQFLGVVGQPVLQLVVPVIQQITASLQQLTSWALTAYNAMAKVFGWEEKQVKPVEQTAAAQKQVTEAVEETEEAQEGSLASFDEIEVLASNTAKATEQTADATAQNIAAAMQTESAPAEQKPVDTSWVDAFIAKLQELKNFIETQLKPALNGIGDGFRRAIQDIANWIDTQLKPKLAEITQKYDISFDALIPDNIDEMFAPIGRWFTEELPKMAEMVGQTFLNMLDPLGRWFSEDLPDFVEAGLKFVSTAIYGLLDTFQMVFTDVWTNVIDPFFMTFAEDMLPVFTQLGTELLNTLTTIFTEVKTAFDMVWTDAIKPVLEFIGKAWSDVWDAIHANWNKWGKPIFEELRTLFKNIGDTFSNVWNTILKPIWDTFMSTIDMLWTEHLLPLVNNILNFVGTLIASALRIYNEFILPIINWLVTMFGPAISQVYSSAIEIIGGWLTTVIDAVNGAIEFMTALIEFMTDVFTGNWDEAWEGIKEILNTCWDNIKTLIKNAINAIIGTINGLINAVVSALNSLIAMINSMIDAINRALRFFGMPTFEFKVPKITAPQIPYLAEGAVIPPNREFLAVLGDQKSGTNIETPLETMLEAFRTALRENGGGHGQQTIILTIDKRELGRVIVDAGSEEERRIGLRLVTT
jgi:phage-related protein